ncbi:hypothetical protein ACJJIR_09855 [Microbulbifer sp. SSSA008]|uniref:hypothetical protein n=1 Tax=Microbulbifer sp. SSSA008 TaxID=3243380 RepID=UPI00403A6107
MFSTTFICRNCVSIFKVRGWFKFVQIVGAGFLYFLILQAALTLLEDARFNRIGFVVVTFLVAPLVISVVSKTMKMYVAPLQLAGVKDKVRGNS